MENSGACFLWYELATTDLDNAKAFYADVIGWGTRDISMPGSVYTLFTVGDIPVAGLMKMPADAIITGARPLWMGYVGVDDVDAAAGRVKELGGAVRVPPTDVPNVSRFSVIADPQTALFALIKGRKRNQEGSVQPAAPGHINWHELLVADPESAFAFYAGLFGWRKMEIDGASAGNYLQFGTEAETLGGMFPKPQTWPWSLWLYYFNVADLDAAAKRVEAGGGQILYGPTTLPGGARIVHCTDPEGGLFALTGRRLRIVISCWRGSPG